MSVEENESLIYRVYDEYNKGNYDVYDECFSDDFISYRWDGSVQDKRTYKQRLMGFEKQFPGIKRTIQDLIVTDDRAALYYSWTGTDNFQAPGRIPTVKMLRVNEMYFIRFKDGKISEYKQYTEPHNIAHQLGMPVPDDPPVNRS